MSLSKDEVFRYQTLDGKELEFVRKEKYDELEEAVVSLVYSSALLKGEPMIALSEEKYKELLKLVSYY
jgi:catabolite regulation protein CreA